VVRLRRRVATAAGTSAVERHLDPHLPSLVATLIHPLERLATVGAHRGCTDGARRGSRNPFEDWCCQVAPAARSSPISWVLEGYRWAGRSVSPARSRNCSRSRTSRSSVGGKRSARPPVGFSSELVFADNLYVYGPSEDPMTEEKPQLAQGPKGRTRIDGGGHPGGPRSGTGTTAGDNIMKGPRCGASERAGSARSTNPIRSSTSRTWRVRS
jgi:hypothetical protein